MSYDLKSGERLGDGVLRVAGKEAGAARVALRRRSGSAGDPVHDARKHIRRARSLLRLAAGLVPGKVRKREGTHLRDAARALSMVRDRQVIVRLVALMAAEGRVPEGYLASFAEKLAGEIPGRSEARRCFTPVAAQLADVRAALGRCESRDDGFPARGLTRTYASGRRAMRAAARDGATADFHEWRKRAKDLRHQLEFLSPLWPGVLSAVADDLHRLTDLLGRANDIDLLTRTLETMPQPDQEELFEASVASGLADWQRELWGDALRAGTRLYADKPLVMVSRMEACWDAART